MSDDLAPPPIDAHEPPPRKRGLGRRLDEIPGHRVLAGETWTAFDFVTRGMVRANQARIAERTAQPVALHRLPEPPATGPINVAEIMAGVKADPPKQRTPGEAAAWLNEQLANPSTAIRVREPVVEVKPEPEPVETGRRSKWADLDEL